MKNPASNKLMTSILVISLVVFLMGEIFKIQHWPNGDLLTVLGLGSYLIISLFEIARLKNIIADSNKDNVEV